MNKVAVDRYWSIVGYQEQDGEDVLFDKEGKIWNSKDAECILFPSKDNRDWSTFKAEKPTWNPETLQPFDKVLAWHPVDEIWESDFFSYRHGLTFYGIGGTRYCKIIPYNEKTKHLLGTDQEAPEYYRI